ncbi:MAG: DUF6062 family protein [Caldicoprobacterales bacterium]|jgi:hypothetical protein
MKYHLDTIPVWDAYHEDSECPFCILEYNTEQSYVSSFLGASVMEPATRIQVNEKGFCARHNTLLYHAQNRLGLALLTHTHALETIHRINEKNEKLYKSIRSPEKTPQPLIKKISGRQAALQHSLDHLIECIREHLNNCVICDRIQYSLNRYAYTVIHLWENDNDFQEVFRKSKGFCFSHFPLVLNMSAQQLSRKKLTEFLKEALSLQQENLNRLEKELYWFTQKFDYQNQEKPWGNSRDALPRMLQKLTGKIME